MGGFDDDEYGTLKYKNFRFTKLTSNDRELHYTVNGTVRFTDINAD